jgi:hypothetical protein
VKRSQRLLLGVFLLAFAADAWAGGVDGTQTLACDLTEAAQCDGVADCADVTVDQIDLPSTVRIDFEARRLSEPDGERDSPIAAIEVLDAVVVIQGHQNGRGWTLVIDRASGHLSATVADVDGAFVVAGACTAE